MRTRKPQAAFTLIELLVVVAIIALLLSILLPSLQCAREQAKAAACGVILRGLGTGLATYATENESWFPGVNTSGIATQIAANDANALRNDPAIPVQSSDWISPIVRYDTQLSGNRAERFKFLWSQYQCPSVAGEFYDAMFPPGGDGPDRSDFRGVNMPVDSYMMPGHFQFWGAAFYRAVIASGSSGAGRPVRVEATIPSTGWDLYHPGRYQSRIELVGPPSRKIAACDATRYLTRDGILDYAPAPHASTFTAFTCNSAWWSGSQAFGVKAGSTNWNGRAVGWGSEADGKALRLSYRHGCGVKATLPQDVHNNKGSINALFFDGHVARLDDKTSRNPELWYPSGAKVFNTSNGLIDLFDVGQTLP